MKDDHYIIEFRQVGNAYKVSAADPKTLEETSIMAPLNTPKEELVRLAVQKLEYVLKKKK